MTSSGFLFYHTESKAPITLCERVQSKADELSTHLLWLISASLVAFFPGPQLWRRKGDSGRMEFLRTEEGVGTSVMLSSSSSFSPKPAGSPSPPSGAAMLVQLPSRLRLSLGCMKLTAGGKGRDVSLPRDEFLSKEMVSSAEELELVTSQADCSSSGCCGGKQRLKWRWS